MRRGVRLSANGICGRICIKAEPRIAAVFNRYTALDFYLYGKVEKMIKTKYPKEYFLFRRRCFYVFHRPVLFQESQQMIITVPQPSFLWKLRTSRLYQKKPSLFTLLRIRTAIITISIPAKIVRTLKYLPGSRITAPLKTEIFPSENTETRLKPSLTF